MLVHLHVSHNGKLKDRICVRVKDHFLQTAREISMNNILMCYQGNILQMVDHIHSKLTPSSKIGVSTQCKSSQGNLY